MKNNIYKHSHKNLYQEIDTKICRLLRKIDDYKCYRKNDDFVDFKKWVYLDISKLLRVVRKHNGACGGGCQSADSHFSIKFNKK